MGLDITALSNARYLAPQPKPDGEAAWDQLFERAHLVHANPHFAFRADGLEDGWYEARGTYSFHAGSVSGYTAWRRWLSLSMLGVDPEIVWNEGFELEPFVELIHFADNEGIIGPKTSAKLADDFEIYAARAREKDTSTGLFTKVYANWQRAFALAAQDGLVIFR